MSKRLILTSIIALCTFVPAFADDSYITNASTCDDATLGSDTSANVVADWSPKQYTVNYGCGTGTAPAPSSGTATYGVDYTFATNTCTKTGHSFNGWSCSDTLGSRAASSTYNWAIDPSNAVTCTAQWTANQITITWDADNGDASSSTTCDYDGTINLPEAPTKPGYTFNGWVVRTTTP